MSVFAVRIDSLFDDLYGIVASFESSRSPELLTVKFIHRVMVWLALHRYFQTPCCSIAPTSMAVLFINVYMF